MASTPPWIFDGLQEGAGGAAEAPLLADYSEYSNCSSNASDIRSMLMQNPYMAAAALPRSGSSSPFQRASPPLAIPSPSLLHFPHGLDPLDQINPGDLFQGCHAQSSNHARNSQHFYEAESIPSHTKVEPVMLNDIQVGHAITLPAVDSPPLLHHSSTLPLHRTSHCSKKKVTMEKVKEESCTQWSPQASISSPRVDLNKDLPSVSSLPSPFPTPSPASVGKSPGTGGSTRKRRYPPKSPFSSGESSVGPPSVRTRGEVGEEGEEGTRRFYEVVSGPQPKKEKLLSLEDFEVMKSEVKSNKRMPKKKKAKTLVALSDRFQRQKKTQAFKKMGNIGDLLVNLLKKNPAAWDIPEFKEVVQEARPYFRKHYGRLMDIPVLAGIDADPLPEDE